MIIPMHKYGFLVYHNEYDRFLHDLQELGVLHIIEKKTISTDDFRLKSDLAKRFEKTIKFLEKRELSANDGRIPADAEKIITEIAQKQDTLEVLNQELLTSQKELQQALPWGDFSPELIHQLSAKDIHVQFYKTLKRKFTRSFQDKYNAEQISADEHNVWFITIQQGKAEEAMDAKEVILPEMSLTELRRKISEMETKISQINEDFDRIASSSLAFLKTEQKQLQTAMQLDQAFLQTQKELDNKLMILEGWVPATEKAHIDAYLNNRQVLFTAEKATPKDKAPILLQNDRFSTLFEPIGRLFSLPAYCELDLTVFFAPFFMLFFGFCLGDAGYGLLFIAGAGIYKLNASKSIKPLLSLIQLLGIATCILGLVSGTFFGINLIEADFHFIDGIRSLFLDPNSMFNLALILGGIQITFGLIIKASNQIRQFGLTYALGTFGWLIILIGDAIYLVLTSQQIIAANKYIMQGIMLVGGSLILLFTDPEGSIFLRMGKGVWNIYATVTGIFGDLLSYLRLFALGLSSAILGFVINEIALEMLHSSPVMGPVLFVVILLLGHTLNIMISSLGSFVHPMRLIFVEFFKNAGFVGGGKEYKPFAKYHHA